ncbi:hypothetical protein D6810_00065 [Candidatus Dojkabacteria bacterium]|uniref:Uncharacterized protein n=1 Tax=Candidatus Dojkabacteria bacterium TaxID=2099670 RepID=A0A3M0Z6J9_9BACT|nr:MAG: hypothetical protein D6810_00065 [Candidatus Dojkabacteria bacterium]
MNSNTFRFNLLSRTLNEIQIETEKKESKLLSGSIFIFLVVVVFISIRAINTFFFIPDLNLKKTKVQLLENRIIQNANLVSLKKELSERATVLEPVITRDIGLTSLLEVAENLKANYQNLKVISYQSNSDGRLGIDIIVKTLDINRIKEIFEKSGVNSIFIRNISFLKESESYILSIKFSKQSNEKT